MSVSVEARELDVAMLTDAAQRFYQQHNPDKLRVKPEIVDEVVKYALSRGLAELDRKLIHAYGVGISSSLENMKKTFSQDPASADELDQLVRAFEQTPAYREVDMRIRRMQQENAENPSAFLGGKPEGQGPSSSSWLASVLGGGAGAEYPVSLGWQVRILIARGVQLALRDPQVLKFQALQNVVLGVVLGSLYANLAGSAQQAYALSMAMVIILGIVAMVTVALGTAVAFADKLVFEREQQDHIYSPVSHFVARLVVGLPINFIIALCLILPSYFWIGLRPGAPYFAFFFGVNLALIVLFDGVVGVAAFLVDNVTSAFGIGNFYEAIAIFMSGIFIPFPLIPPYWQWLYYITPFSYAYAAVALNEFSGTENEWWLYTIGIGWNSQWGNLMIVIVMAVLWRIAGLLLALRVNQRFTANLKPRGLASY